MSPGRSAPATLSSLVIFVHDLESSVSFYVDLLGLKVVVSNESAALLIGSGQSQLYLRAIGESAGQTSGVIGIRNSAWVMNSHEDVIRGEEFLKGKNAHVRTQADNGVTAVEGHDPSGLTVVLMYPGPAEAPRHEIPPPVYPY